MNFTDIVWNSHGIYFNCCDPTVDGELCNANLYPDHEYKIPPYKPQSSNASLGLC